jgi:cytochrome c oxidase assembly protein subunit 15
MKLLRGLTLGATVGTVFAAFMGSYVRGRGAGLACPDWPLCHGQLIPVGEMDALVFLEWFHRSVVLMLSLAVVSIVAITWRQRLPQRYLALLVFGLLLVQAVLGGLTVLLRLNIMVVALHQAFAQVFFGTLVTLTVLVFRSAAAPVPEENRQLLSELLGQSASRRSTAGD